MKTTAPTTEYERQPVYARALSHEAYFCSEKERSSGLFAVPYSYCVQVLEEQEDGWYRVQYAEDSGLYKAVYGYVRAEDFTLLDEAPETSYLYMPVNVTYSQPPAGGLPAIDDVTVTAAFYGNYYSGGAGYSYVLYGDSFGYIGGATENYPTIEITPAPSPSPSRPSGAAVAVFVAIGVLAALAAALFALSGRRRRRTG